MPAWVVRLTAPAEADLDDAVRWTRRRFGSAQAARYRQLILNALLALAQRGPDAPPSRSMGPSRPDLRRRPVGGRSRRYVVYRALTGDVILVVRILHEAMDVTRHLAPPDDSA